MKKIASMLLTGLLLFGATAFADQPTTVLTELRNTKGASVQVPYLDGTNDETLTQNANRVLASAAEDLAGRSGTVTFTVTLNRPSLVSVLLTGQQGNRTTYRAVNIDLTTGKEFGLDSFFFDNEKRQSIVGKKPGQVLFTEQGVRYGDNFGSFVSYDKLVPCARIGDIGRLLRVWKVTENAGGKQLTVRRGDFIAAKLSADPTSGMQWVRTIDGPKDGLVGTGESFVIPHETPQGSTGASAGTLIQFLGAMTPGTYQVKMSYQKPWDKMGGIRQFTYTVVVQGDK
ncbi:MAG: protease inhibitor I42 family protein [Succiniclasticum sp.]|jgi:predicted secreted protein